MIRDLGITHDSRYNSKKRLIEFSLRGFLKASNIYVVGDFCCWFPGAYPMRHEGDVWKLTMPIYEGEYGYVYMVEGYKWVVDPDNPATGVIRTEHLILYGLTRCSVLRVGGDLLSVKSAKGDGKIELRGLYHDQTPRFLDVDGQNIYFKFRTMRDDVSKAKVIIKGDGKEEVEMERIWWDKHFDYYEAHALIRGPIMKYYFKVVDKDAVACFSASGFSYDEDSVVEFELNKSFRLFEVPDWARGAVFYQIFPDRFYNGDTSNDPPNVTEWGDKPTRSNFFGGDLKGIIEKLDYLTNLGVDAIYFTPIFCSESNHKYDIYDYYHVDPSFGDNETLRKLVEEAHRRCIKVILDGVFHHTADEFWAFQDILKNQRKSKYTRWYFSRVFPVKNRANFLINVLHELPLPSKLRMWLRMRFPPSYETFAGVFGMPKLNLLNPEASKYFLRVAEYWIREADIDGWRLDVAFGIPHKFWKKFRSRVKVVKSNAYLLGELGDVECEVSPWVGYEVFDSVMNYPLRRIILDFFVYERIDVNEFDYRLAELRAKLPRKVLFVMYNLLGSHDTPRILTLCKGNVMKAKLVALFQMSFPGAPAIYYGDEVGLLGGEDPNCRKTMVWDPGKWNSKLFNYYKKLIDIRRNHPALILGDFNTVVKDEEKKVFGYRRIHGNEEIVVIINNGEIKAKVQLKINSKYRLTDLLTGKEYESHNSKTVVEIEPKNGLILFKELPVDKHRQNG